MLVNGGHNTNDLDLAVNDLPTFEPLCNDELDHSSWIFEMDFVDDRHRFPRQYSGRLTFISFSIS